jgi:hypothetical protein
MCSPENALRLRAKWTQPAFPHIAREVGLRLKVFGRECECAVEQESPADEMELSRGASVDEPVRRQTVLYHFVLSVVRRSGAVVGWPGCPDLGGSRSYFFDP